MLRIRFAIALITVSICGAHVSFAQTTTPNPCDPAQQDIILQYVTDQVTILQNSGVTPIHGLSSDDNKMFLKLWAKSYLSTLCQGSTSPPAGDPTITSILARLTAVETAVRATPVGTVDLTPVNIRLSSLEGTVGQLGGIANQVSTLSSAVSATNSQVAFLGSAISGDQSTIHNLQSSIDTLNSRITRVTTGPATITNVTITKDPSSGSAYRISWQSDIPSSAYITWGYTHGAYPYQTGNVLSGQNTLIMYSNRGVTMYLKVVSTQSISGVKSESDEFALVCP